MKPSEVPADLVDAARDAWYGIGTVPGGWAADVKTRVILAAVIPEIQRQELNRIAAAIEAEALDMDPGREATDADHLPGLAGNSYWRAMCEANGLWRALNAVRAAETAPPTRAPETTPPATTPETEPTL